MPVGIYLTMSKLADDKSSSQAKMSESSSLSTLEDQYLHPQGGFQQTRGAAAGSEAAEEVLADNKSQPAHELPRSGTEDEGHSS
jgi:hypothetical protein